MEAEARRSRLSRLFDRHGRAVVAILMACLTLFTALVAALQMDASTMSSRSQRGADAIALERNGIDAHLVVGGIRDEIVYRRWSEEIERVTWDGQAAGATGADTKLLGSLEKIDSSLADWLRKQSAMMQPPYFDEKSQLVDLSGFVADQEAASLDATERYAAENQVGDAWEKKANSYVTVLTLVSVALFFLGLASALGSRVGLFFAGAGMALGVVSGGWAASIAATPVHRVPDEAIQLVVQSQKEQYQVPVQSALTISDSDREHWTKAIDLSRQAMDADPGYTTAFRMSANANLGYATAIVFSDAGPTEESNALLRDAIWAWEQVVKAEPSDASAWWNLGWTRYLLGDARGSISATDRALALTPEQFALHFNRAMAQISAGDTAGAQEFTEHGIDVSAGTHLDSNAFYYAETDYELGRMARIRPKESDALLAMQRRLREAQVSLRVLGKAGPDAKAPKLGSVAVLGLHQKDDGSFEEQAAIANKGKVARTDLDALRLTLSAPSSAAGRHLSIRVWRDGNLDSDFDVDGAWPKSEKTTIDLIDPFGRAGIPFEDGAYHIEIYLDGATRGTLDFTATES